MTIRPGDRRVTIGLSRGALALVVIAMAMLGAAAGAAAAYTALGDSYAAGPLILTIPLSFGDVPYLHATEERLNSMLATAAATNGATLVDWYTPSIGHDACKGSSTRWVEPLIPGELAAPVHPNKAGMAGAAVALEAAIG